MHDESPKLPHRTEKPDAGRRRFVQVGLAAAPLLVTLAARPASAQELTNGSLGNYASATATDLNSFFPEGG